MKLFKAIMFPDSTKKNYSLSFCCDFLNLKSQEDHFHSAIFDSYMTARVVCFLIDWINYLINTGIEPKNILKPKKINDLSDAYINYSDSNSETKSTSKESQKSCVLMEVE